MNTIQIELIEIEKVKTNPNNPRIIKDDKFKKLVKSIQEFPKMLEIRPIVVNDQMIVLGGNMRLKACIEAGLKKIHVIKANTLSEEQQKEFKEDYDMTLQNLHKYKGCLRVNFMSYDVKQAKQVGGCATQRNSKEEERQFNLLQKKWGTKIIQKDNQSKRKFDFNPILKSPIKGV